MRIGRDTAADICHRTILRISTLFLARIYFVLSKTRVHEKALPFTALVIDPIF